MDLPTYNSMKADEDEAKKAIAEERYVTAFNVNIYFSLVI